jgi:hypothetical protein
MRRRIGYAIFAFFAVIAAGAGGWVGRDMPFSQQVELLRELREVSTIIFGIMGAWSAIAYPEELKRKLLATEAVTIDPVRLENFRVLMRCLVLSAAIVGIILAMQFAAPIIGRMKWAANYATELRCVSFATGCTLAVGQIWTVLLMLIPINSADADVRAAQETQDQLATGPQGKLGTRRRL